MMKHADREKGLLLTRNLKMVRNPSNCLGLVTRTGVIGESLMMGFEAN